MARQLLRGLPLLSALAAPALAQTTSSVVDILLPGFDEQTILASVVGVDAPTKTTLFLACPTDEDETECGLGSGLTIIEGPSVFEFHQTQTGILTADLSCKIASDTAVCTSTWDETGEATATGGSAVAIVTSGVDTISGLSSLSVPVTITAGLEKLSGSGSGSSASQTPASGSAGSAASTGSGSAATGATATGTSSSTAGMPKITGNAVLAGVAAVVGGAMIM